jgi:serine/threonine protein kinase
VIDFGLAVPARLHAASLTKPQGMRSTRERTITGTIKYAPPERLGERAYPIGPWSDVYAFGMTALESVLGTVRPQTKHWKRLPEEVRDGLRELLERCVDEEYDAADASNGRWHSFEPILAGLRQLKGGTADAHRQAKAKLQGADDPTNDRHSPGEPFVPIAEPRKIFKAAQLRCFVECGGYDGLLSPAKMSAFNSQDECFVSIFPGKQRVYRFDLFGALCEKFRSDAMPLCIAWNEERCEYLIGFDDRRIRRFNARLEAVGSMPVPGQIEPRLLACGEGDVYVSDLSERILRLSAGGDVQHQVTLPGKVCHLAFAKVQRYLIASTPNRLISLNPDLRILWSVDHFASQSTVTTSVSGDIWVALSSGHLWRLDNDSRKLVDVSIPPNVRALAALEKAIVVGTIQGQIQLYDTLGQKVGHDDLQTALYHICATEGELLVLSTARGPTVVKPLPELTLRTRQHAVREQALASLLEWERLAQSDVALHRVLEGYIQRLDLTRWQEVCALQLQFKERMRLQPAVYGKIEEALRFIDPQKAIRICQKTKPVIIDGSNVSRHHWNNERKEKKHARLAAILHIRDKLASETNPVFYPLIVVVDVTERYYTDDLASLKRMIDEGEILETPSAREADALILNLVRANGWQNDCCIVSNDRKLFDDHADMLPGADQGWYELVRMAFTINPRTHEVYFPERSAR